MAAVPLPHLSPNCRPVVSALRRCHALKSGAPVKVRLPFKHPKSGTQITEPRAQLSRGRNAMKMVTTRSLCPYDPRLATCFHRQICDALRSRATRRLSSRFRRMYGYPSIAALSGQCRASPRWAITGSGKASVSMASRGPCGLRLGRDHADHFASCAAAEAPANFLSSSAVSFGGSTEIVTLLILPVNVNGI
jgi:hypothetical protein